MMVKITILKGKNTDCGKWVELKSSQPDPLFKISIL